MPKGVCNRGHDLMSPYADVRIYKSPDGHTQRICRICERKRQKERRDEIRWNYLKARGML